MNKAVENSQKWFKKPKLSLETVKELYTPMIKRSLDPETGEPNGKYPDSFAFKIVKEEGVFPQFSIYDQKKTDFDVNNATENPTDISNIEEVNCKIFPNPTVPDNAVERALKCETSPEESLLVCLPLTRAIECLKALKFTNLK